MELSFISKQYVPGASQKRPPEWIPNIFTKNSPVSKKKLSLFQSK